MNTARIRVAVAFTFSFLLAFFPAGEPSVGAQETPTTAPAGEWKTAFVKRGFVGAYEEGWAKGPGSILRSRTPLCFAGSKAKVLITGCYKTDVELDRMFLVKGADDQGKVVGPHFPILFSGKTSIAFTTIAEQWSDEAQVPATVGTWYVQDSYLSKKMPYAYDVDSAYCEAKGSDDNAIFSKPLNCRVGALARVDVFTTDPRSSILCYGDSITHGYSSTPNAGARYPDQLSKLLDRPVLNMGVNGDVIKYAAGAPGAIRSLHGVDTVIFLMGINDLIGGSVKSQSEYAAFATRVIVGLKAQKLKVYIGTILPAQGYKNFDAKLPEIEAARLDVNTWIRHSSGADGVIDFDQAMNDPEHPGKMRASEQSDWLHPNDQGYRKMAEAAAKVIDGDSKKANK